MAAGSCGEDKSMAAESCGKDKSMAAESSGEDKAMLESAVGNETFRVAEMPSSESGPNLAKSGEDLLFVRAPQGSAGFGSRLRAAEPSVGVKSGLGVISFSRLVFKNHC